MMGAQFGNTRIGGMQYNGVTIGEAMIDGVVVYRSIITVTPEAPTFLDAAPWIELPTVEGVTYTVTGTPGAGGTVTVTAAADDGYELDGVTMWEHTFALPVVQITGTLGTQSRNQFQQACIDYGTTFDTVEVLPFRMDTSQATVVNGMFRDCSSLTTVPDMDTSRVTNMFGMFRDCSSLTDGNVRLIGRHPNVLTGSMIANSGLTREPFYHPDGTPWN